MNCPMPSAILLISLVSYSALAEAQSAEPDQIRQSNHSDGSSLMPPSRASWESWLGHERHDSITTSSTASLLSSQKVGLAASNASPVPSVDPD